MQYVYIVPHTHWDREWYFSTEQSQVLLQEALPVILDELENERLPCFVLDGQSVMLEDFFQLMPEQCERVKKLVSAGKLHIGPWYTQTDQCVVAGESLARNLLYGTRDCEPFGGHLRIGYVPDSFGQTEQLPQLLSQFGIQRAVFWRGLWDGVSDCTEFRWRSRDGSEVITAVIQNGYGGVKGLLPDDQFEQRGLAYIKHLAGAAQRFNCSQHTLVMGGNDQQPWDVRLPALLSKENQQQDNCYYQLTSMDHFFTAIEQEHQAGNTLTTVAAEMLAGKYSRIHRGIYSTRYDIKKANADIETLLCNQLEPILSIAWRLGMAYPHGLIEKAWKNIMQSHAHDSIGCCNTDPVNAAVKKRFTQSMDLCRQQLDIRKRQIAERVLASQEGEKVLLFNTLPEARQAIVEFDIIVPQKARDRFDIVDNTGRSLSFQVLDCQAVKLSTLVQDLAAALQPGQSGDPILYQYRLAVAAGRLPALGYKTVYLRHTQAKIVPAVGKHTESDTQHARLENGKVSITVDSDGCLTLTDKHSGQSMSGLLEFVDGGDDGDNYDFSPPDNDWCISTRGQQPKISLESGGLRSQMHLEYTMMLPANLQQRSERNASVPVVVSVCLTLHQGDNTVDVAVELDNTVNDHRLQAVFRTALQTDVSYADQPFGIIKRASRPAELAEWESEQWTSKPLPLYPMQSFVALNDGQRGLAIITAGIREYEVSLDNTADLAITLFRAVGRLGKPHLKYRPGRLSGMPTETPDSQMHGKLQFRFCLLLHKGDVISAKVANIAKRYLTPVESFHDSGYNRFSINRGPQTLPDVFSVLSLNTQLVVSAVKKTEDGEALLVRLFNPSNETVELGPLQGATSCKAVYRSNLAEQRLDQLDVKQSLGVAEPQQIITLLFES